MLYALMISILYAPGPATPDVPPLTQFATFQACRAAELKVRAALDERGVQFTAACVELPREVAFPPEVWRAG